MQTSNFVNHSYDYRPNWTPLCPANSRMQKNVPGSNFKKNHGLQVALSYLSNANYCAIKNDIKRSAENLKKMRFKLWMHVPSLR